MTTTKTLLLRGALAAGLFSASLLVAQAQTPGTGGPTPTTPTEVPLDGGAGLLLASGVVYGIKRLRVRRAH